MRQLVARVAIFIISVVFVTAAMVVFLWMMGWWPDQLLPWVPFNRI